ncbi:MAG: hypothetical protein ACOVVK_14790 [Elsteraceae bacterium]
MHVVIRCGLLALLLIWAAACQPLPQPFRSLPGERPPEVLLRDGPGIIVDAPSGLYAPLDANLADAVAEALREREFIAFSIANSQVRINRATYRLRGAAASQPTGFDQMDIGVRWRLEAADGSILGETELIDRTSRDRPDLKAFAARTAEALTPFLRDPLAAPTEPGKPQLIGVAIPTLLGQPPGDGAAALPRALESVLKLRGVTATTDPAMMLPGAIRVVGTVTTGAIQPNGQRRVSISWLVQQSDGSEVGVVKLENEVPARLLESRWGETALIVAEASLDGVVDLIERARRAKK